jgi:glycine cleavage system H protein
VENPDDRKYNKTHEWCKVEGDIAVIGISDFAQHSLTDIVFVELPEVGKQIEAGKQLCVVESVKSVSDVFSGVSGEIVEVNKELEENPEKLNQSPFETWIAKIKMSNPAEVDSLLSANDYSEFVKELE